MHVHLPMAVHPDQSIAESSFDLRLDALIDRKRSLARDLFLPPDSTDSNLAELFKDVTEGVVERALGPDPVDASGPSDTAKDQAAKFAASALQTRRAGTLSLSPTAVKAGARIWRVAPGAPRPTKEILAIFKDKALDHVRIQDPYALAQVSNRQAQVNFIMDILGTAKSVEATTIEYCPDVNSDLEDSICRSEFVAAMSAATKSRQIRYSSAGDPEAAMLKTSMIGSLI